MSEGFPDDCSNCGNITAAFMDHTIRFCDNCGFELPISIRLEAAMLEVEDEDRGFGRSEKPNCTEDFHFDLLANYLLSVRMEPDAVDELGPQPKFCPYCGKGLPSVLSDERQIKLDARVAELQN